jgi:DNA-binding HxlR family transcriptional regulator
MRAMKRTMHEKHDGTCCAVAATAELIATKWTPLIVHDLSEGARRFMQLEHSCPGISPRTLSERLDMLERQGVVIRRSYPESPPRVEYELTDKGRALLPIIKEMRRFGRSWMIAEEEKHRRPAANRP